MRIRPAETTDLPAWTELRRMLWPDSSDQHEVELAQFFDGRSTDIEQALVAEVDGVVMGVIEINLRNFAEGSRQPVVPYIEAWCVHSDCRGQGIGRALMRAAEVWALDAGFDELASDTETHNRYSIALHQQLGFEVIDEVVCFLKPLKPHTE